MTNFGDAAGELLIRVEDAACRAARRDRGTFVAVGLLSGEFCTTQGATVPGVLGEMPEAVIADGLWYVLGSTDAGWKVIKGHAFRCLSDDAKLQLAEIVAPAVLQPC